MGRNAALIQYMPQKPTKHGINVFAEGNGGLGCALSQIIKRCQAESC